ncbi:MAG: hypothetical protein U9P79_05240 [Candidatus Cloacimonadota bacterium]|nr:hypothetical protein [Candidatus Cloacimonadota bacterium]
MESLVINILEPKVKVLLNNLVDLKLIQINRLSDSHNDFVKLLKKMRSNPESVPSFQEITHEVEKVRKARYDSSK